MFFLFLFSLDIIYLIPTEILRISLKQDTLGLNLYWDSLRYQGLDWWIFKKHYQAYSVTYKIRMLHSTLSMTKQNYDNTSSFVKWGKLYFLWMRGKGIRCLWMLSICLDYSTICHVWSTKLVIIDTSFVNTISFFTWNEITSL